MTQAKCNYRAIVTPQEQFEALSDKFCAHCGIKISDLAAKGATLEVCAEEFASDMASGERILIPIALCPDCHKRHHLDARGHHNPCQIKARYSRECIE